MGLKCVLSIKHKLSLLEISRTKAQIILFFSEGWFYTGLLDENWNSQDIENIRSTP